MSASEHERVTELLAAWSLDACTVDEEALVEAHLLGCAGCAKAANAYRQVAGRLGSAVATPPPPGLRAKVLAAAFAQRPPVPPAAVAPYAAEVRKLGMLLDALAPAAWQATTAVNGWTVQELVAHLAALDGLLAAQLRVPVAFPGPSNGASGLHSATAAAQATAREQSPAATRAAWHAQADRIVDRVCQDGDRAATRTVELGGLAWPLELQLLGRAFETWIHADDIRQVAGVTPDPPRPEHLNQLAGAVVRLLPGALLESGRDHPGRSARLVLSGDGGGEWVVPLGRDSGRADPPAVTIALDLLDFCYLVGGRRDPAQVPCEVSGDRMFAADLLAAAATFDRD
jgi:uncharacterized protein (TIGR03083 family)